jgi:hypothetical protein
VVKVAMFSPEDEGGVFLRNVGMYLQIHTALQHRRPTSAYPAASIMNFISSVCKQKQCVNKTVYMMLEDRKILHTQNKFLNAGRKMTLMTIEETTTGIQS